MESILIRSPNALCNYDRSSIDHHVLTGTLNFYVKFTCHQPITVQNYGEKEKQSGV